MKLNYDELVNQPSYTTPEKQVLCCNHTGRWRKVKTCNNICVTCGYYACWVSKSMLGKDVYRQRRGGRAYKHD